MDFKENFENARQFAAEKAALAAKKARQLAAAAKVNISIYAEEDKIRKAQVQLGKLYYRDYASSTEMDMAEYLPWCQKIDESKAVIEQLRQSISEEPEEVVSETQTVAAPAALPETTEE
ncbi:MAG: hypothetical protein IIV87_01265 [Oscillospiraceae bacterium]|nr:hypothetical protein [Oscillospiraceae bacterium]